MATNGWDQYIAHIMGFYSAKKNEWTKQNVCESCAIYGMDGTLWAASDKWKGLSEYKHTVESMGDDANETIDVNEFKLAETISTGNRNPGKAGIRLCGQKFMMTTYEEGLASLSKLGGGGGAVARTGKALIIATFDKEALMTNKMNQNIGDVAIGVERV